MSDELLLFVRDKYGGAVSLQECGAGLIVGVDERPEMAPRPLFVCLDVDQVVELAAHLVAWAKARARG